MHGHVELLVLAAEAGDELGQVGCRVGQESVVVGARLGLGDAFVTRSPDDGEAHISAAARVAAVVPAAPASRGAPMRAREGPLCLRFICEDQRFAIRCAKRRIPGRPAVDPDVNRCHRSRRA